MARKRQFVKEEVLLKAMHLFWEKGFSATSMDNLVTTLGVNRASLYGLFGSKKELYHLTIQQYREERISRIKDRLETGKNVRKGLSDFFETLFNEHSSDTKGCFIVNTIAELANEYAEIDEEIKLYEAQVIALFRGYLNEGVAQGQISPYKDLEVLSRVLYHMKNGLQIAIKQGIKREEFMRTVNTTLSVLG